MFKKGHIGVIVSGVRLVLIISAIHNHLPAITHGHIFPPTYPPTAFRVMLYDLCVKD